MRHTLILSLVFPPDSVSTAQIMGDLAIDLKKNGHKVTVITTMPHYNRDTEAEARQPIRNCWGPLLRKSSFDGIDVYHTMMPKKGKNILLRLAAWMGFHLISTLAGLFVVRRADVIVAPSPPLTIGVSAWLLSLFHRADYIYNVQEVYPDLAIRLGAIRSPLLIRMLYGLEGFVYKRAGRITVIADQMRRRLIDKGVPREKVLTIPNFVDGDAFHPEPRDNEFARQHDLVDSFVVSYAGNMGAPQGLDTFLDAAELLRDEPGVKLVMLGDGAMRRELVQKARRKGLSNLLFLPYQPVTLMPQIYAACDASLVPQGAQTASEAIPSKVYRIMACARPVIAVTEEGSDLSTLVARSACGAVVPPGSPEQLAETIREASRQREQWRQRGQSGFEYVQQRFTRDRVTEQYHQLIETISENRRCAA